MVISSIGIFKGQFSNWYLFQKPSFIQGEFYSVKGKAFETGEKFQILKLLLAILFIYL
jgi:hypothetical protein